MAPQDLNKRIDVFKTVFVLKITGIGDVVRSNTELMDMSDL
jgi:hypothetical protein